MTCPIGLYALDRGGAGQSTAILHRVLDHLEAKAEHQSVGLAWYDHPDHMHPLSRQKHPNGCFNLGVSHGIPGVLGFLAEAAAQGHTRAMHLLEPGMAWFFTQAFDRPSPSYYSATLERGEQPKSGGGRLSWCYGDLGISVTLLMVARKVSNPVWEEWALTIAHQCTRRPVFGQGTMDAGLCHGAFGNGHLFGRLYNATGEEVFLDQANRYIELGLSRP
jgi:lantibiotic modifying enzyme